MVAGRSDLFLKLEIVKKILGVIILISSIPFGLVMMCYATIVSSLLCLFVNTYYTGRIIGVGFLLQMRDIMPTFLLSMSIWAIITATTRLLDNMYWQLITGVILAALIFTFSVYLFRFQELSYIKKYIRHNE